MRRKTSDPWVYCSVDYAALELAALGQVCLWLFGDSKMAEAINAGQDLHARLAGRFIGLNYEQALALKNAKDPAFANLRQSAKPVNFGKGGLMGPPKMVQTARKDGVYFCEGAGVSKPGECNRQPRVHEYGNKNWKRKIPPTCKECLALAEEYSEAWYAEWPEMREYHKACIAQAEECDGGTPLKSFGTGMSRLESNPNAVSNHFFQNLAAQGAKHAGWLLAKESYTDRSSPLFNNCRVVVFVHDENMSEIREHVMHDAAYRKAKIMIDAMQSMIPDVKISAEPALMRRWFKGADKALDKNGKLKPWWPVDRGCKWPTHARPDCGCWKWEADQELMAADLAA